MIRIKCPKCSVVLKLDDEEAGQVGQCDDCGAKFRVPAKKAAAPVKATKRAAEEDEDDEDGDDDEQDDLASAAAAAASRKAKSNIVMSVGGGVGLILLALGGVFIDMVALLVSVLSFLLIIVCMLLALRQAYRTPRLMMAAVAFLVLAGISVGAYFVHGSRVSAYRQRMKKELDEKTSLVWLNRDA